MAQSYNDLLADRAAAHAVNLLRFDSAMRRQVLGFLEDLRVTLSEKVAAARVDGRATGFQRLRLETLLRQVDETIARAYDAMAETSAELLAGLAKSEGSFAVGMFKDVAIGADLGVNVLTGSQLRALVDGTLIEGAPSAAWWELQAGDLRERFSREMREGIALGETNDELVRRVRGTATGKRHVYEINGREYVYVEFRGGVMDTSTRNARALVRTSVQSVAGSARRETLVENQDVVKGVVQLSTFDTRTTTTCLAYGGKSWLLPDYEPIDHDLPYLGGVPRHWGCRSTEAPLLRSWEELGIDLDDAPGGVRWSRLDGDVPGDLSMDDFLGRRSDDQVDAMLGEGVAELWRAGKLSLEDLVDRQTGRPLTLRELEAAHGSAA